MKIVAIASLIGVACGIQEIDMAADGSTVPSLDTMESNAPGESYIISPDPTFGTACLFSSAQIPGGFTFQVFPGSNEKFAIVFRGGAPLTTSSGVGGTFLSASTGGGEGETVSVIPFPIPDDAGGVYSRDGFGGNPYIDYTVVSISQCTGDLHLGEISKVVGGVPVDYKGRTNVEAALAWIDENKASSGIVDLVVHGTSSGSIAALTYSKELFDRYQPSGIKRVVTDGNPTLATSGDQCQSYITNTQALQTVEACDKLPSQTLSTSCTNGLPIDSMDVVDAAIEANDDDVLFLEIAAKKDGNIITSLSFLGLLALGDLDQTAIATNTVDPASFTGLYLFYCGTGFLQGENPLFFSELRYYVDVSKAITELTDIHDNYRTFFITTNGHEMMDTEVQIIQLGAVVPAGTDIPALGGPIPVQVYEGAFNSALISNFMPDGGYLSPFRDIETCGLEGCLFAFTNLYEWLHVTLVPSFPILCNLCYGFPTFRKIRSINRCDFDLVKLSKCISLQDYFPDGEDD